MRPYYIRHLFLAAFLLTGSVSTYSQESWPQYKYDCRHSGNVPQRSVTTPLGLTGAAALTDAIFTAPVVAGGHVYAVDGAGVAFCLSADTLDVEWKFSSAGDRVNCNNVSSPAVTEGYLHFGTMAGSYYVLDAGSGTVVKRIVCDEPVLSSPVISNGRVYFATLGCRVYALEPDGTVCWVWDFVKEKLGFAGNRWNGGEWLAARKSRVSRDEQFCCSRDIAAHGKTIIIPAGGSVVWLEDSGDTAKVRAVQEPRNTTLGLSVGEDGTVYRQWTLLDNGGRVDTLRLKDGEVQADYVRGTKTSTAGGLLSFCSVSLRDGDVYRCRPEEGFAFCKHVPGREELASSEISH